MAADAPRSFKDLKSLGGGPFSMAGPRRYLFHSKPRESRSATRKEEVASMRERFPSKIPVIVERYAKEKNLPLLSKTKFLVPQELTMSQFVTVVRNRLQISARQSFYLLIDNRSMANLSMSISDVYAECGDEDGFLYVTYASQEMFGGR